MVEIPDNVTDITPDERAGAVDRVCEEIAGQVRDRRNRGFARAGATVNTELCRGGGHPMYAIREAAKRFASKGWYCYLVRGGGYGNWTWLSVFDREHAEGYVGGACPNYYERVR